MSGSVCRVCSGTDMIPLLDAGLQPLANRFLPSRDFPEERFPLAMGQCGDCGLVQLLTPVPVDALVPRFEGLSYNEPEGHLDAVTEAILRLPGVSAASRVGAITYKDDSTLERLRRRGVTTTWRIDSVADLGAPPTAGLETIQDRLNGDTAARLVAKYGTADVLLVRHILEHAYDTRRFLAALRHLVRPGGYMVFEVPDSTQVFETLDYTTFWEEHVLYFTPATFKGTFARTGFKVVDFASHPYPYENSLVAMVRDGAVTTPDLSAVAGECARSERFARRFEARRQEIRTFLVRHRGQGGRTAMFGAGHLSCTFINLMDVAAEILFVVDDHPAKKTMFMPGSRLPIRGSEALIADGIDLCLSSLSPESEDKVVARQSSFIERGGRFGSVFPSSRRAIALRP